MDRIERITKNLPQQGWTKPEIDKAVEILRKAPEKSAPWVRFLDMVLYWLLLLVTIVGNFIVSIALVPFLLVLTGPLLYGALFFLGVVFGTMLDVVVRETEYLQKHHYVVAEVLIPAIALINIYMITSLSNRLAAMMSLPGNNNQPVLVAVIYVIAFSLPHMVYWANQQRVASIHAPTA